jgi:hypothetical protein
MGLVERRYFVFREPRFEPLFAQVGLGPEPRAPRTLASRDRTEIDSAFVVGDRRFTTSSSPLGRDFLAVCTFTDAPDKETLAEFPVRDASNFGPKPNRF